MSRMCIVIGVVSFCLMTGSLGICQMIPVSCPPPCPPPNRPVQPITRTVQVEVPVPCAPVGCGALACSPPCQSQPVRVKVDVRVRPEGCSPRTPDTALTSDPLRPLFGLVAGTLAAPFRVLESVLPSQRTCLPCGPKCGPIPSPQYCGSGPCPALSSSVPRPGVFGWQASRNPREQGARPITKCLPKSPSRWSLDKWSQYGQSGPAFCPSASTMGSGIGHGDPHAASFSCPVPRESQTLSRGGEAR